MSMLARHNVCVQSSAQNRQLAFHRPPIGKLEQAQSFVVRHSNHSAKRRLDSFRKHGSTRFCGCRRIAKNSSESFAKTAGRFVTAAVFRFIHSTAPAHFAQRETQSARAMVSLECHSIVSLELPSRCGWID